MSEETLLKMSDAAEMVGMTRPTFYRKVKELNLSTVTDSSGKQKIEASELIRVFGTDVKIRKDKDITPNKEKEKDVSILSMDTKKSVHGMDDIIKMIKLEAELEKEKALREQAEEHAEYLKTQIEIEKEEKNKMNFLLTDQREKTFQVSDWQKSLKALEDRIANQEAAVQEKIVLEAAKTAKEAKEKEELRLQLEEKERILAEKEEALALEKKKSFVHKLLGR